MIKIGKPEIVEIGNKSRLQAVFNIDGKKSTVWFEVDNNYGKYLTFDRSDAFVIGVLNYAMRNGHDIECKAPLGEELYYQIDTYLIDAIYKGGSQLHRTKIYADIDSTKLESANAVGTGISCGIDSFHAISSHSNTKFKNHNITHLAFNNVGSHGEGERAVYLYNERKKLIEKFADEYNYKLVESNSNIHDVIPQNHLLTHTYTSCFAIYCLQKLYSIYYYSSSQTFNSFTLKDNQKKPSGYYDLLTLTMFSTKTLQIFSEGATMTRLEKTKRVALYEPSYKYLNVCTQSSQNCNQCEKCTRTLLALDAIGCLEKYNTVFDVEYYKKHKQNYLSKLIFYTLSKNASYIEIYPMLKSEIKLSSEIKGTLLFLRVKIISFIPQSLKTFIKKLRNS